MINAPTNQHIIAAESMLPTHRWKSYCCFVTRVCESVFCFSFVCYYSLTCFNMFCRRCCCCCCCCSSYSLVRLIMQLKIEMVRAPVRSRKFKVEQKALQHTWQGGRVPSRPFAMLPWWPAPTLCQLPQPPVLGPTFGARILSSVLPSLSSLSLVEAFFYSHRRLIVGGLANKRAQHAEVDERWT